MWVSMILLGAMAPATSAPVQRLSDAEIARVLDEAAAKREASEAAAPEPGRGIQGDVGVAIGSGGYRAVHGSAFVPFGNEGGALVTFSSEGAEGGYRHKR